MTTLKDHYVTANPVLRCANARAVLHFYACAVLGEATLGHNE